MPIDTSALDAAIAAATTEVARTETTEDGAGKLIASFSAQVAAAVTAALTADAAANATSIASATAAINGVTARFAAADDKLGAAIVANTPVAPTQTPA